MSAMSDYLERVLASHIFGSGTFAKPTVIAIALLKNPIYDYDISDLSSKEIANAGSYSRQTLNPSASNWTDPIGTGGPLSNLSAVTFTEATADWGHVSGVAICDSATWGTGNVLFRGTLTTPKVVTSGDQFRFKAGDIDIYFD
jgi:hypothetical protein